jgi:hypothetical protein
MYLVEREKDELLKTEYRSLKFPDGETRRIGMFNVYWRWYDRIENCEFGSGASYMLSSALKLVARPKNIEDGWTIDSLIAYMIEERVKVADASGIDFTETTADLYTMIGKKSVTNFHKRNPKTWKTDEKKT